MTQATIQVNGAVTSIQLEPKQFSTGSTGYRGCEKLSTPDGRYQISVQAVKIGSKKQQQ